MPTDPFTVAELEAGAAAVAAEWAVHDGSAYARLVLGAAAPLIAARVREQVAEEIEHEAPGWRIGPCDCGEVDVRELIYDLAAIARPTPTEEPT